MGHLELNLPETLHRQIENIARKENISPDQYVIYALTRQINTGYTVQRLPEEDIRKQKADFAKILEYLGPPAAWEVRQFLVQRETGEAEKELSPESVRRVKEMISEQLRE